MRAYRRMLGYSPIPSDTGDIGPSPQRSMMTRISGMLVPVAVITLSFILGIAIGANSVKDASVPGVYPHVMPGSESGPSPDISIQTINLTFTYNRTFGADPHDNVATEEAWQSIVPLGQGSVRFPPNSQQVYTLSVVHQLHCLWSIHRNYYAALRFDSAHRDNMTSPHMRHCFDYLRQSLTCAADATMEPVDPTLGGVTGWGNGRVCRNYSQLAGWAEEHRVNNLRGFLGSH
ncbi:Uu.00g120100.m01.CDS01 [Anthostomella pinea]|uniref:Uu.00g120100.m01.CDS01 n=1 Tax=Anthostomella pinea TaxID=933095 RepID=A0AAI8VHF4_9PEZI|nr:Uu.00g120100.m01.CDS01 [Anthostomella pinea]